jgi:CheY-like chemotaxis protein
MVQRGCLSGLRVLIVDDHDDYRQSLVSVVSFYGANAEASDCAADARAQLARRRFDVMVSDINMPDEDGCALIASVRRSPPPAQLVRAIAMSARVDVALRRRALDAGFDLFVSKLSSIASIIDSLMALATRAPR